MKDLTSALLIEKNKLASPYPWVPLVEFQFGAPAGTVRLAGDVSDVSYGGQTYTAYHMEVSLPEEDTRGGVPECEINLANQSRAFEAILQTATDSGIDTPVILTIVNTNNLAADYSDLTWNYYVIEIQSTSEFVTVTCGLYNPLDRKYPLDRFYAEFCRFRHFKGAECGYIGGQTSCDRSLDTCRSYNNSHRFGGFFGLVKADIAFLLGR